MHLRQFCQSRSRSMRLRRDVSDWLRIIALLSFVSRTEMARGWSMTLSRSVDESMIDLKAQIPLINTLLKKWFEEMVWRTMITDCIRSNSLTYPMFECVWMDVWKVVKCLEICGCLDRARNPIKISTVYPQVHVSYMILTQYGTNPWQLLRSGLPFSALSQRTRPIWEWLPNWVGAFPIRQH